MIIFNYSNLPEKIPIHFDFSGKADRFGGKVNIFVLPIIASVLYIGLTILNKFPNIFNYPTNITVDNAKIHYRNATRLIRYLKFNIAIIFNLITIQKFRTSNGLVEGLGIWFLPLILGLIFIPIFLYLIKIK